MYGTSRLSPRTRAFLVEESFRIGATHAARNLGTSRRTAYRWRRRRGAYLDRSSRPHRSPRRTPDAVEASVLALRVEQRWGPDRIAAVLGMQVSTVHRILRRHGAQRLSHLFPKPPRSFGRFQTLEPGELLAMDTKALGRLDRGGGRHPGTIRPSRPFIGWRHLHVAIELASRMVFVELRATAGKIDTMAFLERALAHFDARGIRVRRVLTDNGSGYLRTFHEHCATLGLRHTRTKPYHPWTNGRAERFIGTIQRECLYAERFTAEEQRDLAIALFIAYYNAERPHIALGGLAPLRWLERWRVTQVHGDLT